jgi:hypothetical protein
MFSGCRLQEASANCLPFFVIAAAAAAEIPHDSAGQK